MTLEERRRSPFHELRALAGTLNFSDATRALQWLNGNVARCVAWASFWPRWVGRPLRYRRAYDVELVSASAAATRHATEAGVL